MNNEIQKNNPIPFKEEGEMLVLSRKPGEKIVIGGNIVLEVLESCGNRVRIGISAPREVSVVRSELIANHPLASANISLVESSLDSCGV